MTTQAATEATGGHDTVRRVGQRPQMALYVAIMVVGFAILYLVTRSSLPIGDRPAFIDAARTGNVADFLYGNPSHFMQVPLSREIWLAASATGVPLPLEGIFLALSVIGTLAAIVFVGLIAREVTGSEAAAWLAAIIFGTSLHAWTQVNGEQYGLALGFVSTALWCALRGRIVAPALLWALAVIAHSEFMMAAGVFAMVAWTTSQSPASTGSKMRRSAAVLLLAGSTTCLALLVWSWALGKWSAPTSLVTWIHGILSVNTTYAETQPEILRAAKGLVTALTVAGHFWRDIMTGRAPLGDPVFVLEAGIGLVVLLLTGVFLLAATSRRRAFVFALAWLLPFHVLGNWWFQPTVEKYHAGALPGFVLLVTAGLVAIGEQIRPRQRQWLFLSYVCATAGLNFFGALRPMQLLGQDTARAEREVRQLAETRGGRAVFITCDAPGAVLGAGVPYLRLRSVWTGSVPEIEQALIRWTSDRLGEDKEPYLVGRWCFPEDWTTTWSKEPFDLLFLERSFKSVPTSIVGLPMSRGVSTNPFSWTRGDVTRLEPK
jgi:hypothetical protein